MSAYMQYAAGQMVDFIPTDEELNQSLADLPKIPGIQE